MRIRSQSMRGLVRSLVGRLAGWMASSLAGWLTGSLVRPLTRSPALLSQASTSPRSSERHSQSFNGDPQQPASFSARNILFGAHGLFKLSARHVEGSES